MNAMNAMKTMKTMKTMKNTPLQTSLQHLTSDTNSAAPRPTPGAPALIDIASAGSSSRDLHLVGVTISYQGSDRVPVTPVSDLSFYAPSGRITALVGRSGSGKTSILSCIAATLRPTTGQIWLGGTNVALLDGAALDAYRRRGVGVVHQAYNLIPSLSALENVMVPMGLVGTHRRVAALRAKSLLAELGLADVAHRRPSQLSGGQQQRVAVARALANDPALVIADEPTAHLDGGSVDDVRALLRSIAADGRTVVMSTHDDRLLDAADQVLTLGHVRSAA